MIQEISRYACELGKTLQSARERERGEGLTVNRNEKKRETHQGVPLMGNLSALR